MSSRYSRLLLMVLVVVGVFALQFDLCAAAERLRPLTLRDGFFLAGIDGKLAKDDGGEWQFELAGDIDDGLVRFKAGKKIKLLPSSTLEKMTANLDGRSSDGYRLWARATKYKDENFLFAIYFLPVSGFERPAEPNESGEPDTAARRTVATINDPNDALSIPDEVVAKLQKRRIVRIEQLTGAIELKADGVLTGRTGFISRSDEGSFCEFDGLGKNIDRFRIELLDCYILERAERTQQRSIEPIRFKFAGIVSRYKDKNYLLLQRAEPAYTHGNFSD